MTLICLRDGCMNGILDKQATARFCSDSCRVAQWKADHLRGRQNGAERRRGGPSGLQVTYRKAVNVAAQLVFANSWGTHPDEGLTYGEAHDLADEFMREALSPAQRARLEARS